MNTRISVVTVALLAAALTACGSSPTPAKAPSAKPTASSSPGPAYVAPVDTSLPPLADTWAAKVDTASGDADATGACQQPSSTVCAGYVSAIMTTVDDLEAAISGEGRGPYPETRKQIADMRAASAKYNDLGCVRDPAADDPNSECSAVVGVTVGSASLQFTLGTDEARMLPSQ